MRPEGITTAPPEDDLIDLPELARTLNRYKWGVIGIALLSAAGGALYAFSLQPIYRGTVTLLIESKNQRVVQVQDVYDPGYGTDEYLATQYSLLNSRDLAERVIDKLGLVDRREEFMDEANFDTEGVRDKLDLRRWLPFLPEEEPEPEGPEAAARLRQEVVRAFQDRVIIEPVRFTQLVKVNFESYNPELAAAAPNALADLFIESGLQSKLDATRKASQWLTDKLSDITSQLERSEQALQAFLDQEKLVNVGGARGLTESEVLDYVQRHREAQKRRQELASAYDKVRQAGTDPRRLKDISNLLIDPFVQRASDSLLSAQEAVKSLEERYGAKHPQMAAARARLDTAQAAFSEQLRVAAAGVKTEYELAQESERVLAQQVANARAQIQNLDRKDYQLSVLQRDVATNRALYDTFLARFKETDTVGNYDSLNARFVDPAVKPIQPYKPEKKKIVLLAGIGGFIFGVLLALLRHLLSEEIHSAEELEHLTRLPVYGVLPLVEKRFVGRQNLVRTYLKAPKSAFGEGMRSVRAGLQLSDVDKRFQRVMVTSSVPKEGKSSVASTLALSLGAMEQVLLVDADLRLPSLSKLFDLPPGSKGVTDILCGNATLDECIAKYEPGGIWVLPAGTRVTNPAELLSSEAFAKLVGELSGRFQRVIFDTPPCQAASDTRLLARHVHAVLFVVKSDATSRRAVRNSLKHLQYVQAPLLGNIVNQVNTRKNPYYLEGHYYAYGYYG